jgi:hypothetical protein
VAGDCDSGGRPADDGQSTYLGYWATLSPSQILCAVRVRIVADPLPTTYSVQPPIYAGQPLAAEIRITTSFHWGAGHHQTGRAYRMRFDVEEMVRSWLVSGRKRGDFSARVRIFLPALCTQC